ncbi:hypothetical protein [Kingella potus]|uniref:hypothetical protein n=1 Tax=Kingella potus TaxID=265175 RepID=UPI001FD403E6|nr:hypothetical protein [Kingella potus]UOP00050.1 hypothetical protein LVJ84_08585 [Kingella potus]
MWRSRAFQTAFIPSPALRGRVRVGAVAVSAALAGGKAALQTAPSPTLPRAGAGEGVWISVCEPCRHLAES